MIRHVILDKFDDFMLRKHDEDIPLSQQIITNSKDEKVSTHQDHNTPRQSV